MSTTLPTIELVNAIERDIRDWIATQGLDWSEQTIVEELAPIPDNLIEWADSDAGSYEFVEDDETITWNAGPEVREMLAQWVAAHPDADARRAAWATT